MFKAYGRFWKNYVNFKERATRGDYWWPMLCQFIIAGIYMVLLWSQMVYDEATAMFVYTGFGSVLYWIYLIFGLACILPTLSVAVRRLHDIGKSGWWYLLILVPCVGGIVILVFMCMAGTPGPNKYGEDPKASR